jgi:hypothetical protein
MLLPGRNVTALRIQLGESAGVWASLCTAATLKAVISVMHARIHTHTRVPRSLIEALPGAPNAVVRQVSWGTQSMLRIARQKTSTWLLL